MRLPSTLAAAALSAAHGLLFSLALGSLACAIAPTPALAAQVSGEEAAPEEAVGSVSVLERVVVIGASASDGFLLGVNLADALEQVMRVSHQPVAKLADSRFFSNPTGQAQRQVEAALALEPTLVIALDYLFWLGYGRVAEPEDRITGLNRGLAQLERFDCPVVIGSFPDMSESIGKMLSARQVPPQAELEQLNARLTEWLAEREGAYIYPLGEDLESLRKKEPLAVGGIRWPASVDEDLLLRDRLHPNTAGLAGVTCRLAELLVKQELAPAHALDLDPRKLHMALEELTAERLEERRRIRREKLREPREEHVERGSSGGR